MSGVFRTAVLPEPGVGSLRLEQRERLPVSAGQVRVSWRALSFNFRDLLVALGQYGAGITYPLVPGSDAAGEVIEVGGGVTGLRAGDRVCSHMVPPWRDGPLTPELRAASIGGPQDGVFAEESVVQEQSLLKVPGELPFEQAACLPVAGLTAWSALTEAGLPPGGPDGSARVLLLGTGGVSVMGLALAKAMGHQVALVSGSAQKEALARASGADFVASRHDADWPAKVRRWSGGGVDLVLEVGGDGTFDRSLAATRDNGTLALIGVLAQSGVPVRLDEVLMRRIRVQGTYVGSYLAFRQLIDVLEALIVKDGINWFYGSMRDHLHLLFIFVKQIFVIFVLDLCDRVVFNQLHAINRLHFLNTVS